MLYDTWINSDFVLKLYYCEDESQFNLKVSPVIQGVYICTTFKNKYLNQFICYM